MEKEIKKQQDFSSGNKKIYLRDQLVTQQDLQDFKLEFFEELKKILQPQKSLSAKPWLKGSEVRKLLGFSPGKLQTLRISGKLPSSLVGNVHYYKYENIEQLMKEGIK